MGNILFTSEPTVFSIVYSFVIDSNIRRRPRSREEIDGNPSQNLIFRPRIIVRPIVQLFVNPGEEADGAVGEEIAQGLRLGALFALVAAAVGDEPV